MWRRVECAREESMWAGRGPPDDSSRHRSQKEGVSECLEGILAVWARPGTQAWLC